MQNIEEFLLRKHCKEGAFVVTRFWTPRARDNVYLFRTKCKSVAHICWKIDKNGERNIFFETLFELFSASLSFPFAAKIIRFSYTD